MLYHLLYRTISRFRPSIAFWGVGAAGAVALFFSSVPIFQVSTPTVLAS
jgi:hypothetical protein